MDIIGKMGALFGGKKTSAAGGSAEDMAQVSGKIRATEMFQRLSDEEVSAIIKLMQRVAVRKGDVVVREGAEGDYYYVLLSGSARVSKDDRGKPRVLAELQAGAAFGEEALISNAKRNASVTMLTDGAVFRLSKDDFNEKIKESLVTWVSPAEAQQKVGEGAKWLDAREESDPGLQRLRGAVVVPLTKLRESIPMLSKDDFYICYCQNGRFSSTAAFLLAQRGFKVAVMRGGLQGLQRAGLL